MQDIFARTDNTSLTQLLTVSSSGLNLKFRRSPAENTGHPAPVTSYGLVLKFLAPSGKGPLDPSDHPHCWVCGGRGAVVTPLVSSLTLLSSVTVDDRTMQVFSTPLEKMHPFNDFADFCSTFLLTTGKSIDNESEIVGEFKVYSRCSL